MYSYDALFNLCWSEYNFYVYSVCTNLVYLLIIRYKPEKDRLKSGYTQGSLSEFIIATRQNIERVVCIRMMLFLIYVGRNIIFM